MQANRDEQASSTLVGAAMAMMGLGGLALAAGALDDGMYVFGLSLAGFAAAFVAGLLRRHYDRADQAAAAVRVHV